MGVSWRHLTEGMELTTSSVRVLPRMVMAMLLCRCKGNARLQASTSSLYDQGPPG